MVMLLLQACTVGLPAPAEPDPDDRWGRAGCIDEVEPNGFEGDLDYHFLGVVSPGRHLSVCGVLTRTGVDSENTFDGDLDYYVLETLEPVLLTLELTGAPDAQLWVAGADLVTIDGWLQLSTEPDALVLIGLAKAEGGPTPYTLYAEAE